MTMLGNNVGMMNPASSGYQLQRSLRFRSIASAYLSKTPAAGNRKTWTWSGWHKVGSQNINQYGLFSATSVTNMPRLTCGLVSGNTFIFSAYDASNALQLDLTTTQVFRDSSSWYHFVIVLDTTLATAADRVKLYVNGIRVTSFAASPTYPAQNSDVAINSANEHNIGKYALAGNNIDGLLTEVNFIDGQALTPTSFGAFDSVTGVWGPAKYTGSYGTNGFYLPFTDNTALTTASNVGLGKDFSGNGNYWVTNNISITAGATYDSFTDVPTLTSATASNFAVLNPLSKDAQATLTDGNLGYSSTQVPGYGLASSSIAVSTGKWYWEFTVGATITAKVGVGVCRVGPLYNSATYLSGTDGGVAFFNDTVNTVFYWNGASQSSAAYTLPTCTTGDIISVALDLVNGGIYFAKNGTWGASGNPATQTAPALTGLYGTYAAGVSLGQAGTTSGSFNFGQRQFAYTPPTGFVALNTFNLPDSTIKAGNKYFDVVTRNGLAPGGAVTSLAFQPDLVWDKPRNVIGSPYVIDSVRGVTQYLLPNTTQAEIYGTLWFLSFDAHGFTVGANDNPSSSTVVDWCWKKGATPGFDIVPITVQTSGVATFAHSLGVAPKFMIVKYRNAAGQWYTWHSAIAATGYVMLNQTSATTTDVNIWNSTAPSSSVITLGSGWAGASLTAVAYLWSEIPGFSKFGSYTGNGSADGVFCYLGFKPKMILVKCSTAAGNWYMFDTSRDSYNVVGKQLYPNLSNAETTAATLDVLSNGFKMRLAGDPNAAQTYIVAAWADSPFKYSLAQ